MPFTLQRRLLQAVLETLLAEAIDEGELDFLEDRTLAIWVTDMGIGWNIVGRHPYLLVSPPEGTADATIQGQARAFALLASGREDPDTLFFRRELSLEGDTELGLAVKNLLDSVGLDALPAKKAVVVMPEGVSKIFPKISVHHLIKAISIFFPEVN